jgi:hypothetical protein
VPGDVARRFRCAAGARASTHVTITKFQGDINEYPHHRHGDDPCAMGTYGIRARGQRRPLGLTVAERTLLIAGTVFGVIVPIGFALVMLWYVIN